MKFVLALSAPALLLAGSAIAQPAAPYRAVGTEPGWTLSIERGLIRYIGDYGTDRVIVPAPVPRPSFNGRRYVTPRITVDITSARCSDGMSDRVFPDSVTVTIGRRTVRGCGGKPVGDVAASPIIAGTWRIVSVGDVPTRGARPATLSFTGDRIGGNTGCNGFGGTYHFYRGFLTVTGPLVSTQMACPGPVERQERAILGALNGRLSVSSGTGGKLVLTGRDGTRIVLARFER